MDWLIRFLGHIPAAKRLVGLLFQRHLHQRSSIVLVADELDYNAGELDNDRTAAEKFDTVSFAAWDANNRDVQLRLRNDPELWRDVSSAYSELRRMKGGVPASGPERYRETARKLRATLK
jgi:hypothetical protein